MSSSTWAVSKNTVAKLMAELGLVARRKKRRKGLTKADVSVRKAPDLLQRHFDPPEAPNVAWVGDLTEIPNDEGPFYLASVLELAGRRCVGRPTCPKRARGRELQDRDHHNRSLYGFRGLPRETQPRRSRDARETGERP